MKLNTDHRALSCHGYSVQTTAYFTTEQKIGCVYIYIKLSTTVSVFVNCSNSDVRHGLICSLENIMLYFSILVSVLLQYPG